MKRIFLCLLLLGGCTEAPLPSSPPPAPQSDIVAVWNGGEISLIEVEDVLRALPANERDRREALIFDTYREISREIALLSLQLPATAEPAERLIAWRIEYPEFYRHLVAQLYASEMIMTVSAAEITGEEVETYYREHPGFFHQPPRRQLRHIFRRALKTGQNGENPVTVLTQVRARALAGEPFEELARIWSQSENRRRGGEVGWVERGMLPKPMEEVVFALGRDEISMPVTGKEGALLFYVEQAVEEKDFPFEDVRLTLRRHLLRQQANERVADAAREILPPEGTIALSPEEIAAAAEDTIVLRIPSPEAAIEGLELRKSDLPVKFVDHPGQLALELEGRRLQALLWVQAEQSGFTARPEIRRRLAQTFEAHLRRSRIGKELDAAARLRVAEMDTEVRALYDADPLRFASPLSFRLRQLRVPLGDLSMGIERLETIETGFDTGEMTFEDVARDLGGNIVEIGWKSFNELAGFDSKEQIYVLDLGGPGYTPVYRLGESLNILQVVERRAPRALPWEEARALVGEEYLRRNRDTLWEEAAMKILDAAGYRYLDENVRAALAVDPAIVINANALP